MLRKITHIGMALAVMVGTSFVMTQEAEARRGRRTAGIVAGSIIGLGVLGAYAASRDRGYYGPGYSYYGGSSYYGGGACYKGRPRCNVVGQICGYNRYGEYRCRDDVRCYRPTICD
jgi:hypothetical protein